MSERSFSDEVDLRGEVMPHALGDLIPLQQEPTK